MTVKRKNKKKMLITGVSGLLGSNLAYYFRNKYDVVGLYNSHPVVFDEIFTDKCDLSHPNKIREIISANNPHIVIHCASLTNIDECEVDKDATRKINVVATRNIVEEVLDRDTRLIYISTDAVYDGVKGNRSEKDRVNPQNFYGLSKYEGELEVLQKEHSLVLRTNIFGWNIQDKNSLGEWILGQLKTKERINGFRDAYFSSIYTMELARVIDISLQKGLEGVYNCGASDGCSKYEFSLKIADCFGLDRTLVTPISIDDFSFKAKRGKNLTLDVNKLQKALDYRLPTIDHSIEHFYRDDKVGLREEIRKDQVDDVQKECPTIPYGRQWVDGGDIESVVHVLRSERITQGPQIEAFENALAEYCGAKCAIAVNSGTSALHIACLAAGVEHGDEVITSPITFVASANCAVYCGAKPVFGDIDLKTFNIAPEEIEKRITRQTQAVIPVHFAGQSCDMASICRIVREKGRRSGRKVFIIEDGSHALGSTYKNVPVGSSVFSDMTVMSFHPVKHITTGEGGMVLTNDETLARKLRRFRSHGITSDPGEFNSEDLAFQSSADTHRRVVNPWYYEQVQLGFNYRITDMQCALGCSQLEKLNRFRERRREIVRMYNDAFTNIESVQIPFESSDCESNSHLYILLFDFEAIGIHRAQFMNELGRRGIRTQVHYIPVHLQPFYREHFGTNWGDCPNAENYYARCLSIPLFPAMTDLDVGRVINEIVHLVRGNSWTSQKA